MSMKQLYWKKMANVLVIWNSSDWQVKLTSLIRWLKHPMDHASPFLDAPNWWNMSQSIVPVNDTHKLVLIYYIVTTNKKLEASWLKFW